MFERSTSHKQLLRVCHSQATWSSRADLSQKSALTTPLRACLTVTIIHYTGTSHVVALLSSIDSFWHYMVLNHKYPRVFSPSGLVEISAPTALPSLVWPVDDQYFG